MPDFLTDAPLTLTSRSLRRGRSTLASPRYLVVIAAAAAATLVIALTGQQLSFERKQAAISVLRENELRVQSFEQFVLRTLELAELASRHAYELARQTDPDALSSLVQADQTLVGPLFTTVIVHRGPSDPVSTRPAINVTREAHTRLVEIARRAPGKLTVTEPVSMTGADPQIAVVRDLPRGATGYVAVFIDPRRFTEFADDIPFANHDLISLIGLDGTTRARRTGAKFSSGEIVTGLVMGRQEQSPNGSYLGPSVLDGIPRYFSHRRIPRFELFVTSGMPATLVNERIADRRSVQLRIMAAALSAILCAALILIFFINRGQRQIARLTRSNTRLKEAQRLGLVGDWDYFPDRDELHWSENLRNMYGRRDDQSISSLNEASLYAGKDELERTHRKLKHVLATGERITWQADVALGTGESRSRRIVAGPIYNAQQQIVGVHGTDQDITTEVKVRRLENKLAELARLDSISALAATFAHELNQPLAAAANYLGAASRILRGSQDETAKAITYLGSANDQINHIGQIITGARELLTHSSSDLQEEPASRVIESLIVLLEGTEVTRKFTFEIEIDERAKLVRANIAQLKQVLFNLSRNGIEAVPLSTSPAIRYNIFCNADSLYQFEVTDNGSGFPDSQSDPFATLSTSKSSGLGLGLSLARTIVEAHGGRIWIKKSTSEGSTVAFTLNPDGND